ncbi:MAG: PA0069 family radical SAM protein [Gammaproteobacteria bacterium]|nr:PA0069 family radical SAM protein [Gammaproteobacteria bacterium]
MQDSSNKGRGAQSNPDCRYQAQTREAVTDDWFVDAESLPKRKTTVLPEHSKTILSRNQSPDVPFSVSINPYRGCEHGCVYCFARPTHAYLDLSPGLDFETQLFAKPDAPALLRKALAKRNYVCQPIALGSNTDPYQPIERSHCITRQILEILLEHRHPVAIVTKSSMVERDIDILAKLARDNLVQVMISVCTLDKSLARVMEPRASAPQRRLQTIARLHEAGIPVGVLVAPIIPVLNDPEIETIVQTCAELGAGSAGYVMLRLPLEVAPLFEEWLHTYFPLKAEHVLTRIRDTRDGELYRAQFGERMRGTGAFAAIIGRRFEAACQRFDLGGRELTLATDLFQVPEPQRDQLALF